MSSMGRLAAARAQRQQDIELAPVPHNPSTAFSGPSSAPGSSILTEAASIEEDIKKFNSNVALISATRTHYLTSVDGTDEEDNAKLAALTAETSQLSHAIKQRIQQLERQPASNDAHIRSNQISLLRKHFLEAIQNYQRVERDGDQRSRQQISKQLHIVKPDATPEEVQAFIDGGQQQVFAQALTSSTRYGESRSAYKEVQDRQQDLRRMEKTLSELAQLTNDMAILVEQQDSVINAVEATAIDVEGNTKAALDNTGKAVIHAKSYRRGRWICFGIVVLVLVILAIVLGVIFGRK